MDGGRFRPGAAQLILSGSALAVFLCIHVKQFRFGELAVPGDIHTLARATLSDRKMAGGYCVAVVALGVHLWKGWGSVVIALRLGPEHTANARFIGRLVVRTLPCMLNPGSAVAELGAASSACPCAPRLPARWLSFTWRARKGAALSTRPSVTRCAGPQRKRWRWQPSWCAPLPPLSLWRS